MIPALTKGGAERVAVDLANSSARNGHMVTVVAGWKVDEQLLRVRLLPVVGVLYMIDEPPSNRLQCYRIGFAWILRNLVWLLRQDVLHLHLTQMAVFGTVLYILRWLSRVRGPAIIETYHAVGMRISDRLRYFHAWNCQWRDAIVFMALDPFWQNFISRNPALPAEMIPNGIDAPIGAAPDDAVLAYLREIGVPRSATRIIGTVGQFRADRSPMTIARILIDVLKRTPDDVHALFVGSGPELESVRALVTMERISARFTLPGIIGEPRLAMSAMSLYLTINVGEVTGIAALEAAYCGTALVGLQMLPNELTHENNWIWSSSDPACVTERMISILADSDKLSDIAKKQHAHAVSNHAITSAYERYVKLYNRIIKMRGARIAPGYLKIKKSKSPPTND